MAAVSDEDELTGLLHSYRAVLQDCETKLPSWWNGDGQDIAGVKAAIEARRVVVRKSHHPGDARNPNEDHHGHRRGRQADRLLAPAHTRNVGRWSARRGADRWQVGCHPAGNRPLPLARRIKRGDSRAPPSGRAGPGRTPAGVASSRQRYHPPPAAGPWVASASAKARCRDTESGRQIASRGLPCRPTTCCVRLALQATTSIIGSPGLGRWSSGAPTPCRQREGGNAVRPCRPYR